MGCRAIEMSRRWDIAQKNVAQMMLTQVESQIFFIFLRFLDIFFIEIIGKILVGIVLNSEDFRVDSSLIEWLKKINYSWNILNVISVISHLNYHLGGAGNLTQTNKMGLDHHKTWKKFQVQQVEPIKNGLQIFMERSGSDSSSSGSI